MINIHSKLVKDDLRKIGVDAFAILICITSYLNKKRTAWPGIDRLRAMTGLSRERAYKAIKTLTDGGYIQKEQRNQNGQFGNIVYTITTKYLSIFVAVDNFELEEETPLGGIPYDGNPYYGNAYNGNPSHISIDIVGSIDKQESINKIEVSRANNLAVEKDNLPFNNQKKKQRNVAPKSASQNTTLPTIAPGPITPPLSIAMTNPPSSLSPPDWIEVAKLMTDYAKGEGASQWEFMATAQGYKGEPERILSNWASKATPYQLMNWKKEFPKIQTWMRNEALNDYKNKVVTPEAAKKNFTIL